MPEHQQRLAVSRAGMVTSPHTLASEAGVAVLRDGGNAAEAAIATAAAIAVTYPHFCGLGGDAVWMLADTQGPAKVVLGIGRAATTLPHHAEAIPQRGPGSAITSACAVDSWQTAFDYARGAWQGTRSFASLLAPAIDLAENGFPVTASQVFWRDYRRGATADWSGFAAIYGADTGAPQEGERFIQMDLARSLKAIARHGAREFYEGDLGRRIAAGLAAVGSPLDAGDLAASASTIEEPLRLAYGDVELLAPPPPTQGATTLAIMGILRRLGISNVADDSAVFYHLCTEAVKQAFLDRAQLADPEFATLPADLGLSPAHLDARARAIDPARAQPWPHLHLNGDTVYIGVVDAHGRSVSLLQSTFHDWGSGVVVGDTGILWQNRGAAFSVDPRSPNVVMPRKRPFYTLNPGIALRDGRPCLLYGTQGADGQPQTLSVVLSRILDFGLDPARALAAPRFLLGRTFSDTRDNLKLEGSVPPDVVEELQRMGHEVALLPPLSPLAGQAGAIRIDGDGTITGAHDPRSDGRALAV